MNYEFYVNINISEMLDTGLKNYDVLIGQKDWLKKKASRFFEKKFEERSGQGKHWLLKVSARKIF